MAVNKDPILKRCRSLQLDPSHMGIYKESNRKPQQSFKKMSEYGLQLREKQRAKFIYGVQERQFRTAFKKAASKKGITGENLLIMLEERLDNVVFRMGLATTRREARQLVVHSHFTVNGKKVNIPSYIVKAGDVIKVKEKSQSSPKFKEIKEMQVGVPAWLSVDRDKLEGKVLADPTRDQIDTPIEERLIVELYSK
ncbi:30S ribosomal protein S4 [Eubacterium sulci ATCC 35585]|jgi:ribosomal protein S4|nr:30S ribosomal protein S4 [Eubacterium sulci ATCC 35585]MBF1146719.1 30S ribosomal protein S4 [[Eubacterium] sulci]EUC77493.1 ribosomal protein S4 [Eubacterium sulci ATCC 35585]MBF1154682.1 30S ribosomal protein S4 [[Eubacterium] sulci]MBF1166838.1 30S ribosomal protein S4 [[Eubacterium] sulci]